MNTSCSLPCAPDNKSSLTHAERVCQPLCAIVTRQDLNLTSEALSLGTLPCPRPSRIPAIRTCAHRSRPVAQTWIYATSSNRRLFRQVVPSDVYRSLSGT